MTDPDSIYTYTDDQAVDDGCLIPFLRPNGGDTGHRITRTAFETLCRNYRGRCPDYDDAALMSFFFNELLALAAHAVKTYDRGGILRTTLDFRATSAKTDDSLWYIPNGAGLTMMLPSDY